jgi:16S rRNA (uracil1498-N3)-methyltransferase
MSRFFVKEALANDKIIKIAGEDFNHIKNVLRLRCGDNIIISNCNGYDFLSEIKNFEDSCVYTQVIEAYANTTEPPISITLYQGLPKSDKMDFVIQKSIELGVKRIVPVITERTIVRIEDKKSLDNKLNRWQRIALEAAKQCNRGTIPEILYPVGYEKAVKDSLEYGLSLIPYEKETSGNLKDSLKVLQNTNLENIAVFIGPEGGFTEKEIEMAVKNKVQPVTLGPRILRTETAGIAILSILMYELGDVC